MNILVFLIAWGIIISRAFKKDEDWGWTAVLAALLSTPVLFL